MPTREKPLHMDIPVTLSEVKVVFSIAALAFEGDLAASIFHLQLITQNIVNGIDGNVSAGSYSWPLALRRTESSTSLTLAISSSRRNGLGNTWNSSSVS